MKNTYFFFAAIILLIFTISCKNVVNPDTTPPQISISFPTNDSTVKDSINIKVTVADDNKISHVEFLVDGDVISLLSKEPFEIIWNTRLVANGKHNLQCKAIDDSGNEALSNIVQVNVNNYLFKATFINEYLEPGNYGYLFISDTEGNLIAEKEWIGDDSFELFPNDGLDKNIKNNLTHISVTVTEEPGTRLYTYLNVPIGSYWTWRGLSTPRIFDDLKKAEFIINNIPNHNGYTFSTNWNNDVSSSGQLSENYTFYYWRENYSGLYIKLNTISEGVKYFWDENYEIHSYYTNYVDLSNMNSTLSEKIDLPDNNSYYAYLYGINNPSRSNDRVVIDYSRQSNTASSFDFYYPNNVFDEYMSSIWLSNDENEWFQQLTFGNIPTSFSKINADFEFINTSSNNFEISANGDFLGIRSQWRTKNKIDNNTYAFWYVYSDNTILNYTLPKIYPDLIDRFELRWVQLFDHSELNSYSDRISIVFNSDDYLYDVVNDIRRIEKYPNSTAKINKEPLQSEFQERDMDIYY